MPIASWILHPGPDQFQEMIGSVSRMNGCEVHVDSSTRVAILVTDTPDQESDKALFAALESAPGLSHMSLVFAHAEVQP